MYVAYTLQIIKKIDNTPYCKFHKASWVLQKAGWFLLNPFIHNLPVVQLMKECNSHINVG